MSEPVRPYYNPDGSPTSGWAGSATSMERANWMDASGQTLTNQQRALRMLYKRGEIGLTAREFGVLAHLTHQTYSSVMSVLHKEGFIVRLKERRNHNEVYVLPQFVNDRPVSPRRPTKAQRIIEAIEDLLYDYEVEEIDSITLTTLRRTIANAGGGSE